MAEIIIPEEDLEMGEENVENPDEPIIPEYTPNSNETELREELEELKTTVGTYSQDIESLFDRVGKILNSITISEDCRNLTDIQKAISNEIIKNVDGNNIYIFVNNSSIWFADKTWDNLKGVNALLSMDGDYVRIYYINNVTFTSSISYNPSTQAYNFSQWTYRELPRFKELKSGEAIGSQNGKILTYDPSNGVGFSPFYDTDFFKNDVIKGVIEVTDIAKSSLAEHLAEKYPGYIYDSKEAPQDSEYIQVNPLSLYSKGHLSGPVQTGMYIFVNKSQFALIKEEGGNPYRDVYGFCSVVNQSNSLVFSQYIYYQNTATYYRTGRGYTWSAYEKTSLKNLLTNIIWYNNMTNIDNYDNSGVYVCDSGSYSSNSNLPKISGEFSFVLNVSAGDSIVGQTLMLTSKDNNETKVYTRIKNGDEWGNWCEPGSPCDLGQISNSDLKNITTPGLYKGVINEPGEKVDTLYQFVYNICGYNGEISQYYDIPQGSVFELEVMSNNVLSENTGDNSLPVITQRLKLNLRSGHSLEIHRVANILREECPVNWWHMINKDLFGYENLRR